MAGKSPKRKVYSQETYFLYTISHRIHGAGIYANIGDILMVNVTIYSSTMDPMGYGTIYFQRIFQRIFFSVPIDITLRQSFAWQTIFAFASGRFSDLVHMALFVR